MQTLGDIGERDIIRRITAGLADGDSIVVGPGDDCAVVRPSPEASHDWVLTSDPVIENRHFTSETDPRQVGHKAVARALSDIAAMGARPTWALVDVVAPATLPVADLEALYAGLNETASRFNLAIVGGDVAQGDALQIHVFATGNCMAGGAVLRSGARLGDAIFVTGTLGGSALHKHLDFEPRVAQGLFLADWASAMMDVSDGIATDAQHLADESKVGLSLTLSDIPVSHDASRLYDAHSPLHHALCDGEDFELLFTLAADRVADFQSAWQSVYELPCTRIGEITDAAGCVVGLDADGKVLPLSADGFEHFRAH